MQFHLLSGLAVVHAEEQNSQTSTVINEGTLWKYLDNNTDPAEGQASLTAWTEKGLMTQYGKQPQESSVPNEVLLLLFDGFYTNHFTSAVHRRNCN